MLDVIKNTFEKNGLLLVLFSGALIYLTHLNSVQYDLLMGQIVNVNHRYDSLSIKYLDLKENNMYCGLKLDEQNKKIEQLYNLIIKLNNTCDNEEWKKITKKEFPLIFALKDKSLNYKAIN